MDNEPTPAQPIEAKKEPNPLWTPTGGKKRRVNMNSALAIMAVHERKQINYHVDYRSMAPRFNMGAAALRKLYCWWVNGRIELPPDIGGPGTKTDDRELMTRARDLARRDVALVLSAYEGAVFATEDRLGKKGLLGKKRRDVQADEKDPGRVGLIENFKELRFIRAELKEALALVGIVDGGFDEYLQQQIADLNRQKAANANVPIPLEVQDSVHALNDHDRGLDALRRAREKAQATAVEVEVVSEKSDGN